jgi:hypothetical protein
VTEEMKADQEWKEQARAEKERLAKELDGKAGPGGAGEGAGLPPADFMVFVSGLATQALISLGLVPDPLSGKQEVNLPLARYNIDLIAILEQKTEGNLTPQEESGMKSTLSELRLRYVEASSGETPAAPEETPDSDPKIVTP